MLIRELQGWPFLPDGDVSLLQGESKVLLKLPSGDEDLSEVSLYFKYTDIPKKLGWFYARVDHGAGFRDNLATIRVVRENCLYGIGVTHIIERVIGVWFQNEADATITAMRMLDVRG